MTRRKLDALLANLDIYEAKEIPKENLKDYDMSQIHSDEAGRDYIVEKGELDQSEINTALLAEILQGVKTIKSACIFFVFVLIIICIILFFIIFG